MRIPGKRVKRQRLIQTDKYVVAVDVEMVIPADDPSEPCYEAETINLLREVKEHAERATLNGYADTGRSMRLSVLLDHRHDLGDERSQPATRNATAILFVIPGLLIRVPAIIFEFFRGDGARRACGHERDRGAWNFQGLS